MINIKKLSKHMFYKNTLEQLSSYYFNTYAINNKLYNDFDFITYFKDKDKIFWVNVISNTSIPIKKLFWKFPNKLNNNLVYETAIDNLNNLFDTNKRSRIDSENIFRSIKNLREYIHEYKRNHK